MKVNHVPALPVDAEELIPHRKPMCMVDRLIEFKGLGGSVETVVSSESVLVDDTGQLDPLAVAEMIAQAYAAVKGYADRISGKSGQQGFLVGIRKIWFPAKVFAGQHLRINVHTVGAISGFAVVEGEVTRDHEVVAQGELKLWIQEDRQSESEPK